VIRFRKHRSFGSPRGFTLIEVLVALVIVSLGMMAVQTQLERYVLTARFMEDKTLASWIGTNKIVELSTAPSWPSVGTSDQELEFAQRQWLLEIEVSETQVENLRRVDVNVAYAESPDTIVQRVSGLIEPPAPQGFVPVRWLSVVQGGAP
jgi:general secretion pathway protein I